MALLVGSARLDENGKATGGAAGDQTKKEVCTQAYYVHSKGWYVLRPKSKAVADKLAAAMLAACENDNIGYDQHGRLTVVNAVKQYGAMAKITEKVEGDCSSLVRACCIEAGFEPANFTTANEAAALAATGMFEDKKAVTSSTKLYNGDVLVTKTKGHTVIVVSGNPPKEEAATTTTEQNASDAAGIIMANDKEIWSWLRAAGLNEYATAAIMGNIRAESAGKPSNMQNSYEKKLGYNDDTYTAAVDNGSYSDFVKDGVGYGLCQWTYWTRKQALLEHCRAAGASIGSLTAQLGFMLVEMKGYKAVWAALAAATDVRTVSDVIILKYEKPADTSEAARKKRAEYGQAFYEAFAAGGSAGSSQTATAQEQTYKVVKGDTLTKIANQYGTTVAKIVSGNKAKYPKITANYIVVGWELKV